MERIRITERISNQLRERKIISLIALEQIKMLIVTEGLKTFKIFGKVVEFFQFH